MCKLWNALYTPPQNKELIPLPISYCPSWSSIRRMSGLVDEEGKHRKNFITRWSRFSYEMPTNLWLGERSRVRIQYHRLPVSVFIRHFLSAVKGRLECFTVSAGWNIATPYDSVVMDWSAVCSQDTPASRDRLTEALTHEHNLSLRQETIYHPLWVPSQRLTASGDCSQRWTGIKNLLSVCSSHTWRQSSECAQKAKSLWELREERVANHQTFSPDSYWVHQHTPQTHVCVQQMDQHISRATLLNKPVYLHK